MAGKEKKKNGIVQGDRLVVTLPDGRHKTNLRLLIRTDEAKEHFKAITKLVNKEKKQTARK